MATLPTEFEDVPTEFEDSVLCAIERWAHEFTWLTYLQIRRGIPTLPISANSRRLILTALAALEEKGYVQSKGKLWGLTPQYDASLRLLKAVSMRAR